MSLGDLLRKEGIENMALHCIYSYREGGVQEGVYMSGLKTCFGGKEGFKR